MSSQNFVVNSFVVPAQYIRQYRYATFNGKDCRLRLSVKQYVPINRNGTGGITILAAGGNGFPKEMYEPLWDEVLRSSKAEGYSIKAIVIADMAHQGQSGILNRGKIGHDPSWFDHARDLLQVVNFFGEAMTRPIVGIGHSVGATSLINLGFIHPRLLSHLILFEPILGDCSLEGMQLAYHTVRKPDAWISRLEAEKQLSGNPPFNKFDPRVYQTWLRHGLTDIDDGSHSAVLTTSKYQEAVTYIRPLFQSTNAESSQQDPAQYPGFSKTVDHGRDFYCPAAELTLTKLPELRPRTLYLFGAKSGLSPVPRREQMLQSTGAGIGGSGGLAYGKVKSRVVQQCGHLLPFEDPEQCARIVGEYLSQIADADEDESMGSSVFDGSTNQMSAEWNRRLSMEVEATSKKLKTKL